MKRYFTLFYRLFLFSIQSKFEYRLNLVFKLMYRPAYILVLLSILLLAYHNTETLNGWNRSEAILLFSVFNMIYATCLILFMDSIRYLLWSGIRLGEVDQWLLKPGSAQFFLTFSRPDTNHIGLWLGIFFLFIYQLTHLPHVSLANWVGFFFLFIGGHVIVYLALSTYATLGFFFTRAQQIMEVFDKASDFAQYPLPIFPQSLQLLLTTFLPIAFFSYYPTLFLKGEGSIKIIYITIFFILVLSIINRLAWKYSLRHYSSASS